MRRILLYVSLALLTFTVGFLLSGTATDLPDGLAIALPLLGLAVVVSSISLSLHHIKVAVLTLLIWTPIAVISFNALGLSGESCDFYYAPQISQSSDQSNERWVTIDTGRDAYFKSAPDFFCGGKDIEPEFYNSVWIGVIDDRAIDKPAPQYLSGLRSTNVHGVVAVSVLIDEAGKVVWAQSVSGHPLLRQAAREAACQARFTPGLVAGRRVGVSGILTYRFGL